MSEWIKVKERPTVVIIHDAWHTPTHYSRFIDTLTSWGFEVACPQLLTCTADANNASSFSEDVSLIYSLCFDLASEGNDIICVVHGYGAFVGSEILTELCKSQREESGQPGGVVSLVWIASFMPETGQSLKDAMGGEWPDYMPEQVRFLYDIPPLRSSS